MSEKKYNALVLGSSGLIGTELLHILLKNTDYKTVYAISRKPLDIKHPHLQQIIGDMDSIPHQIKSLAIDHFFCCIGSTQSKTPNKQDYYRIDHDYPIQIADILKNNTCRVVSLVSSIGADSHSKSFYLKLKGDTEKDIIHLNFESTNIFQPSILIGKRKEKRFFENIAQKLSPLFNLFMLGKFKNYRSIKANTVAQAMVNITLKQIAGVNIYKTEDIKQNA